MSSNHIVIRAEEDSVIAELLSILKEEKDILVTEVANALISDSDREAVVAAGRIYQLDRVVDYIAEIIEEQNSVNGDKPNGEPTRYTS